MKSFTHLLRYLICAALLGAAAVGCDGGAPAAPGGQGGAPGPGAGGNGAGGAGGAGPAGVPLVDWVTDLAVSYAPDTSQPDTVEDKVIIDTSDPQAFDTLLQQ